MGSHLTATGRHLPYGITVTRHKWTRPALAPACKLVLDLRTAEVEGLVDLGYSAMHRPGFEPAIFRSLSDALALHYRGSVYNSSTLYAEQMNEWMNKKWMCQNLFNKRL